MHFVVFSLLLFALVEAELNGTELEAGKYLLVEVADHDLAQMVSKIHGNSHHENHHSEESKSSESKSSESKSSESKSSESDSNESEDDSIEYAIYENDPNEIVPLPGVRHFTAPSPIGKLLRNIFFQYHDGRYAPPKKVIHVRPAQLGADDLEYEESGENGIFPEEVPIISSERDFEPPSLITQQIFRSRKHMAGNKPIVGAMHLNKVLVHDMFPALEDIEYWDGAIPKMADEMV